MPIGVIYVEPPNRRYLSRQWRYINGYRWDNTMHLLWWNHNSATHDQDRTDSNTFRMLTDLEEILLLTEGEIIS